MSEEKKYSIGEVSAICNVPIKTLRYYDEIELIVPKYRKKESNYRYYEKDQMILVSTVKKLRLLGFSLKEVREFCKDSNTEHLEKSIRQKLDAISDEIKKLNERYEEGEYFLQRMNRGLDILRGSYDSSISDDEKSTDAHISVEVVPEMKLFFQRKVMNKYQNTDFSVDRWIEIEELTKKRKRIILGPVIVTYHDAKPLDQFLGCDCDVEFGVPINAVEECDHYRKFGGFTAVTAIHIGPYSSIVNTHIKAIQWINENNYQINGPVSEEFIISPVDVENEAEHVTKIIIPVQKNKKRNEE